MVVHRILIGFLEGDLKAVDEVKDYYGISNRTETVRFCIRKVARRVGLREKVTKRQALPRRRSA
jgi:hypothetical protein